MDYQSQRLIDLAERIRTGDREAENPFREEAHPGLVTHLRYALCVRQGGGLLSERARKEAVRLRTDPRWQVALGREYLIQQFARRLCNEMIIRLRSNRAVTRVMAETILN